MRFSGRVARLVEEMKIYKAFVGKLEGKRPLARPRSRWVDGIRMHLREIGWGAQSGYNSLRIGAGGGLL
jgi:hypothetical protein